MCKIRRFSFCAGRERHARRGRRAASAPLSSAGLGFGAALATGLHKPAAAHTDTHRHKHRHTHTQATTRASAVQRTRRTHTRVRFHPPTSLTFNNNSPRAPRLNRTPPRARACEPIRAASALARTLRVASHDASGAAPAPPAAARKERGKQLPFCPSWHAGAAGIGAPSPGPLRPLLRLQIGRWIDSESGRPTSCEGVRAQEFERGEGRNRLFLLLILLLLVPRAPRLSAPPAPTGLSALPWRRRQSAPAAVRCSRRCPKKAAAARTATAMGRRRDRRTLDKVAAAVSAALICAWKWNRRQQWKQQRRQQQKQQQQQQRRQQ
jgi:hypothetical protein